MLKNYYSNALYSSVTAAEFDENDKKKAISVFSRCHKALFWYLLAASIAYIAIVIIFAMSYLFFPEEIIDALKEHPAYAPLVNIFCIYLVGFPVYLFMLRGMDRAEREKSTVPFMEFLSLAAMSIALMQL